MQTLDTLTSSKKNFLSDVRYEIHLVRRNTVSTGQSFKLYSGLNMCQYSIFFSTIFMFLEIEIVFFREYKITDGQMALII